MKHDTIMNELSLLEQIRLKDLSLHLPYHVMCSVQFAKSLEPVTYELYALFTDGQARFLKEGDAVVLTTTISNIKLYLRSLDSMTNFEFAEFQKLVDCCVYTYGTFDRIYNIKTLTLEAREWLLRHHFDFTGMIEAGFAIKVTLENNPYIK